MNFCGEYKFKEKFICIIKIVKYIIICFLFDIFMDI